jgi:protein O-mannosyl-transferase
MALFDPRHRYPCSAFNDMTLASRYHPALIAAIAALLLYAVTLKGTFIEDDVIALREDPRLYEPGQWRDLLTGPYWFGGSVDNIYRPLVSLSYALQWHLIGDKPPQNTVTSSTQPSIHLLPDSHAFPFHAVNWILNAIVAAMVAELARRLAESDAGSDAGTAPAYLAGLLFAVHPIHVEAVAGLVGRAEMMCAIGLLGAIILLLHRPLTILRVFAIVGCLAFAILSKEQGMLLPLLMLLLPLSLRVKPPKSERQRQTVLWLAFLVCACTASYIIFRESKLPFEWDTYFLDFSEQPMVRCSHLGRVLMPFVLLGHYAQLLIFPFRLSPDYGGAVIGWVVHINDPYLYAGIAVAVIYLAVLAALVVRRSPLSRPMRAVLFCLLAAGALYGMVGNIVSLIGTNFGERLMYLPSAFLMIAASIILTRLPRSLCILITTIAIVLGSIRTFTYAREWNDRLRFYELTSAAQPKSVRLHMLVAVESLSQGKMGEAKEADRAGRESLPDYPDVWIQSATIALAAGEFDEADVYLKRAMEIQPSVKATHWQARVAEARAARKSEARSPKSEGMTK